MMKQWKRTDLLAQCTGLVNEQPPFDLLTRAPYSNDAMCMMSIGEHLKQTPKTEQTFGDNVQGLMFLKEFPRLPSYNLCS